MSRQFITFLLLAVMANCKLFSQDPNIIWQNTIGGSSGDYLKEAHYTPDGGVILGGYSISGVSGDKTEGIVGGLPSREDYWIVKLDPDGNIEWQNTIGGSDDDFLTALSLTEDGGYIVGGYSKSGISGDKTEASFAGGTNGYDYWVLKLDASGNIIWQNDIGGTADDYLQDIVQADDGGYVLAGYSSSGISGDKTESASGVDYWVVKLNAGGSIVWQNTIKGGSTDYLHSIIKAAGGGYILAGESWSSTSADKTDPNVAGSYSDYWIIKIDGTGNIVWQNDIGGIEADYATTVVNTPDGGYMVAGKSYSPLSADKTKNCYVENSYDFWILKLSATGVIEQQNTIGGVADETPFSVIPLADGYLVGGTTSDDISGEHNSICIGINEYWVLKLNLNLEPVWQYSFGGASGNEFAGMEINADNELLAYGYSSSNISGQKTENSLGSYDYWVLKIAEEACDLVPLYTDADNDLFGVDDGIVYWNACEGTAYASPFTTDCNDQNDLIHPDAPEICDGIDNNCSGDIDEGIVDCIPAPFIEFQNTIGGSRDDLAQTAVNTNDGGYLIGGNSSSNISFDKTENNLDDEFSDFWIVKTDANLNIVWQNTIGANYFDNIKSLIPLADGSYFIAGESNSGVSGDKTEPSFGISTAYDYWVLKLDASGNVTWQEAYGGSSDDHLTVAIATSDGGFLLGGYSNSPADGVKTENSIGGGANDFWIIKINAAGAIQWQNTIGGSATEYLRDMKQTNDGGYILLGYSVSGISGDKTEANIGGSDYWVVKLNAFGNIEWQNTIGGTDSDSPKRICLMPDGGYAIGGTSKSPASGDKSEAMLAAGVDDFWIVRLDATGSVVWENTIGGTASEIFSAITTDAAGNILIGGSSASLAGPDKLENTLGDQDYWVLKLDGTGNIIWQNTIGSTGTDYLNDVIVTTDQGFLLAGYSDSHIAYDKSEETFPNGFHETSADYWIIKLFSDCLPGTEICNTLDDDCNGIIDDGVAESISISAGGATTFCQGGTVLLSATYSGASVQWKKNGTNIPGATSSTYSVNKSGNYTCITTSACGTATSNTIAVTVNKNPPSIIAAEGPVSFCQGGSVVLTANTGGGLSYQWYKGASAIAGATSINYTATLAGNYKCRVTKTATGCYKNSNVIAVTVPCKEGEANATDPISNNSITIYPNPNNGTFIIKGMTSLLERERGMAIEIYNSLGQIIYSKIGSSDNSISETIELNDIAKGIYIIKIQTGESINEQKMIVE